jgi:hypothetical protein
MTDRADDAELDTRAILARRAALVGAAVAGLGLAVLGPSGSGLGPVAHAQSLDGATSDDAATPTDAVSEAPPAPCLTAPRRGCGCE